MLGFTKNIYGDLTALDAKAVRLGRISNSVTRVWFLRFMKGWTFLQPAIDQISAERRGIYPTKRITFSGSFREPRTRWYLKLFSFKGHDELNPTIPCRWVVSVSGEMPKWAQRMMARRDAREMEAWAASLPEQAYEGWDEEGA